MWRMWVRVGVLRGCGPFDRESFWIALKYVLVDFVLMDWNLIVGPLWGLSALAAVSHREPYSRNERKGT